jgi:hypothetical protein
MRRSGTLFGLLICGLIVVLTAQMCGKPQQRAHSTTQADVYLNHADTVDYVGKETCLKCHTDKHTFLHTGMGLSFDHASPDKSAADFKPVPHVYDSFNDLHYTAFWRGKELWMKEYRLENGDTIHQLNQKIDFIVGSGQHTNSHLFKVHDLVFQAPMTWYAQKGKWDLPPGFENGNNSRFSRWIDLECMSCHNAMPVMKKESGREFLQIGQGIDCERCHGPGELHVQLKMKGRSATDEQGIDRSIVNPAKLSWDRQIDLCQRCHLQGLNQLKEGKTFTDYKPGMVLKDVFEIYLPRFEGGKGRFDMANHAQRLQMSECFIKSGSGEGESPLTCISCHNPHVSVKLSGKAVFNQQCVQCHQDKGCSADQSILLANDNNCVQCHMPPTDAEDIPHVSVHDHYIRKPLQAREKEQIGLLTGLYSVNNPKPETADLLRAYLSYFEKFDKNPFYLEKAKELLSAGGIKEKVHYAYLIGNTAELIRLSEPYLEEEHKDAWTAYRIGEAFLQQKQYREADLLARKGE